MEQPQIRYATTTSDGVSIAYWTMGEGRPLFVSSPLTFAHAGLEPRIPAIAAFYERIAGEAMLIRWDPRNYGMSQRGVEHLGIEDWARDVTAVADSLHLDEFDFLAINAPYPTVVAAQQPGRIRRLVLLWPPPVRLVDLFVDENQAAVRSLAGTNWQVYTETLASFLQGWEPHPDLPYARFIRESIDQADYLRTLAAWREWDATPYLPNVSCPTLVVSGGNNSKHARMYAAAIPGARFLDVEVGTSNAIATMLSSGNSAIEDFLREGVASASASSTQGRVRTPDTRATGAFRTVLFTDIVGHTEMMQRLGDDKGRDVLREHERITREVLKAHGGAEVKTMGDGFMASFGSVTKAMDCAIALQRAFATHNADVGAHGHAPLHVRVGLNAGEPIEEDGDLFGSTVILASRIAAQAGAGEILIPEPLRHLLSGKSYVYADRGEVALKGFEDVVRLYEVRWRE